jgi:hypothetical protein
MPGASKRHLKKIKRERIAWPVPPEIKGWNWGAFLLSWVWGVKFGVPKAFFAFVPGIGLLWPFVLGFKGNEWAWISGRHRDVEAFRRAQRDFSRLAATAIAILGVIAYVSTLVKP